MKKKITKKTTRAQLAAIVSKALSAAGIDVVLVGGSAASLYSGEEYVTDDIDFVHWTKLKEIEAVMLKLGFKMVGRIAQHPDCKLHVDFNASPLAISSKFIPDERLKIYKTAVGTFKVLSPTDSAIDRLSHYYFWNDKQCLEQAVTIASTHKINMSELQEWSLAEGFAPKLKVFLDLVETARSK